jgi:hypothetical protein
MPSLRLETVCVVCSAAVLATACGRLHGPSMTGTAVASPSDVGGAFSTASSSRVGGSPVAGMSIGGRPGVAGAGGPARGIGDSRAVASGGGGSAGTGGAKGAAVGGSTATVAMCTAQTNTHTMGTLPNACIICACNHDAKALSSCDRPCWQLLQCESVKCASVNKASKTACVASMCMAEVAAAGVTATNAAPVSDVLLGAMCSAWCSASNGDAGVSQFGL